MYNPFTLEGKTILVTGASSGIGRGVALECSKMGARVIAWGRDQRRLEETIDLMYGEGHRYVVGDIVNSTSVKKIVEEISVVDGIVLAAGKGFVKPFLFSSLEAFQDVFACDFFAQAEILRLLVKNKKIKNEGSVVLIVSVGGVNIFVPGNCVYGTAKAALNSLVRFSAIEFASKKIRVNGICPGMVVTPLIQEGTITNEQMAQDMAQYPLKRYGTPQDVALCAVYLLSDASSWVTGQSFVVDGGISAK